MPLKDKKALDRLVRRAEAIQRHLDEVTRAAREELLSIRDQMRALNSTGESIEQEVERRASIFDHEPVRAKNEVKTILIVDKEPRYSGALARQIQLAGFNALVATAAEGGLKQA